MAEMKARNMVITLAILMFVQAHPVLAQKILLDVGTLAPEGSPWHEILLEMRQEWRRISGDRVQLRIYPSGVQGDEVEMLRKVRIGQLEAVALSSAGLSHIDKSVASLQIPMAIESYEELDYVVEKLAPRIETAMAERGFIVLNWGDVGWVHFFTKEPARTLDDIRRMRLFTTAGDPETEKLYKKFGFHPIPLAMTDMIPSLQTGLIDAFDMPPLFALLEQSFALTGHMISVRWAPLVAATVVSERAWKRIPEEWREPMREAARRVATSRRDEIRRMGDEAVVEMEKRGLVVFEPDAQTLALWKREAEDAYPRLRGTLVPEDLFDEVLRLRDQFRVAAES